MAGSQQRRKFGGAKLLDNKAVVRRLYECVLGQGDVTVLDEILDALATDSSASAQAFAPGRDGFRQHVAFFRHTFANLAVQVDDLVSEGDRVVAFWSFRGVQRGELWGAPPTGRLVTGTTVSILRVRNGRVVEYESRPNRLDLLTQLGNLGNFAEKFAAAGVPPR